MAARRHTHTHRIRLSAQREQRNKSLQCCSQETLKILESALKHTHTHAERETHRNTPPLQPFARLPQHHQIQQIPAALHSSCVCVCVCVREDLFELDTLWGALSLGLMFSGACGLRWSQIPDDDITHFIFQLNKQTRDSVTMETRSMCLIETRPQRDQRCSLSSEG